MTDTEILDWLDAQGVYELELDSDVELIVNRIGGRKGIRKAVIQARDNQDEADGMRHYEGLRG